MKKFIITLLCFTLLTLKSYAYDLYSTQISVDITDKNVALAKQKALSSASRDGLNNVILNISTKEAVDNILKLNDNQIQHFIKSMQILMEKSSDIRYIADIKLDINEEVLKSYLKENDFPIIISTPKDILLIPLFEAQDGTLDLWTSQNILREELLKKTNLHSSIINFRIIEKNLGNISSTDANTIYDMTEQTFNELTDFNRSTNITVIKYSTQNNKLYAKSFNPSNLIETTLENTTLSTALDDLLSQIKGNTPKEEPVLSELPKTSTIEVLYTFQSISSWIKLKKLLEQDPQITNLNIVSMTNKKVHFNFNYNSNIEKLQATLAPNGYNLKNNGDFYVIN